MAEAEAHRVEHVGDLTVFIQEHDNRENAKSKKHPIITFHDIGLNYKTCFEDFLNHEDMKFVLDKFTIYHIHAPGQEPNAEKLSDKYQFPSMQKLAEMVGNVIDHFGLDEITGFGVGAGANVLLRLALLEKHNFLGLILVEPTSTSAGWEEWGKDKIASWQLERKGYTDSNKKFLIWHHFGKKVGKAPMEKVDNFITKLASEQNAHNLAYYIRSYMSRSDITKEIKNTKCNVLVVGGEQSPHKEEVQSFLTHLKMEDMKKVNSLLLSDTGADALDEEPAKVAEGFLLFVQGLGLVPSARTRSMSRGGTVTMAGRTSSMCDE